MKTVSFLAVFYKLYEVIYRACIYLLALAACAFNGHSSLAGVYTPTSVNYHFTRKCNYKCGFCFHTAKTSFVLPMKEAKRGLQMLKESGMLHLIYSLQLYRSCTEALVLGLS